jgi:hypothetical protein
MYDGEVQPITPDPIEGGELRVPTPLPGQRLTLGLRSKMPEKIAAAVLINGKNTLEQQESAPEHCRKWILPPDGELYGVKGFYDENDVVSPIRAVEPDDERVKNENSDRLGLVEIAVFVAGPKGATLRDDLPPPEKISDAPPKGDKGGKPVKPAEGAGADDEDAGLSVSRLGLSFRSPSGATRRKVKVAEQPEDLLQAKKLLAFAAGLKGSRNVFLPDRGAMEQRRLQEDEIPNPVHVGTIVIRYYKPGSAK